MWSLYSSEEFCLVVNAPALRAIALMRRRPIVIERADERQFLDDCVDGCSAAP
jgi:hypothetical protein